MVPSLVLSLSLLAFGQPAHPSHSVTDVAATLEAARVALERADAAHAMAVANTLPAVERIELDGQYYECHLDWLKEPLRTIARTPARWPALRDDLTETLGAMRADLLAASGVQASQDPAPRRALTAVLSQRGFTRARRDDWQEALESRIEQWLSGLWAKTLGRRVGRRTIAVIVAWVAAAAALIVLMLWIGRATVRRRLEEPLGIGTVAARRAAARELAIEAASLVRAGRTRDAVRVAYRAAVSRLEEEGALRSDEARTPREYLGTLPAQHRRRPTLARLTVAFERTWYGVRAAPDVGAEIITILQDLECLSRDHAN